MKATYITTAGAIGALVFLMAAPGQAAVTFGSANVHSNALATSMNGGTAMGNGNASDADSAATFTSSLDASSYADAASVARGTFQEQSQASEDASASFSSASSGMIEFSGEVLNNVTSATGESQGQDNGEYYNYVFTVTSPVSFDLSYNYVESYSSVVNTLILLDETANSVPSNLMSMGIHPAPRASPCWPARTSLRPVQSMATSRFKPELA